MPFALGEPAAVNHYERLKVNRDAPLEVIRAAYRALAAKHHPDRVSHSRPDAPHADMAALNSAYEVLANPTARAAYDAELKAAAAKSSPSAKRRYAWRHSQQANDHAAPEQFQPTQFQTTEFQTSMQHSLDPQESRVEVNWLPPSAQPLENPWMTKRRLVPMAILMGGVMFAIGAWWANLTVRQMEAERTLSSHYDRQIQPGTIVRSEPDVATPPPANDAATLPTAEELLAGASSSTQPSAADSTRAAVAALARPSARHPLDGTPLGLRPEGRLVETSPGAQP